MGDMGERRYVTDVTFVTFVTSSHRHTVTSPTRGRATTRKKAPEGAF
jgi:hypothetical protein